MESKQTVVAVVPITRRDIQVVEHGTPLESMISTHGTIVMSRRGDEDEFYAVKELEVVKVSSSHDVTTDTLADSVASCVATLKAGHPTGRPTLRQLRDAFEEQGYHADICFYSMRQ